MEPFAESLLKSTGRLRKRFMPAVYFDPSFFARYALSAIAAQQPDHPHVLAAGAAATGSGAAEEAAAFAEVVERVHAGTLGGTPILSSLTLLRWMQDIAPVYRDEDPETRHSDTREESDFEGMRFQSWLNRMLGDSLDGLVQVELMAFTLPFEAVWDEASTTALLDTAERHSLHALAARHLGCTYLATMRPEMARICEVLVSSGGPRPLLGARSVLLALTT